MKNKNPNFCSSDKWPRSGRGPRNPCSCCGQWVLKQPKVLFLRTIGPKAAGNNFRLIEIHANNVCTGDTGPGRAGGIRLGGAVEVVEAG